jgi:Tol biopolymer transport system component
MISSDRFDRRLPEILEEISQPRTPDYFDDLVGLSARTHQRPAWSLLERWLPVVDIARQPAFARQVPWRPIAVLTLILLLIAATLAWVAGSQPRVPAPFGPARNGLVVYSKGGDIFTADPVTGLSTAILKGPGNDVNPRWSDDGTRVAFERIINGDAGDLYVARADGSDPVQVTPQPVPGITSYAFSPNDKEILFAASASGIPAVFIAEADGSGIHRLDVPGRATDAQWRPPDGSEILVMDDGSDQNGTDTTIYSVSAADGKVRTILQGADADGRFRGHATWSPDGTKISFGEWMGINGIDVHTHIMNADGTGDRSLPMPTGAVWQAPLNWSNDGTRLLAIRGYTGGEDQSRPVIVPVDGTGPGLEFASPSGSGSLTDWAWAPDDSAILGTPTDVSGNLVDQVLLDPAIGTSRTPSWGASVSQPSWQRIAP